MNAFVASFIGSPAMNLRTAALVPGGAQLGSLTVPLRPEVLAAAERAGLTEITLGLRPESLRITTAGEPAAHFTVTLAEELGADAFVYRAPRH